MTGFISENKKHYYNVNELSNSRVAKIRYNIRSPECEGSKSIRCAINSLREGPAHGVLTQMKIWDCIKNGFGRPFQSVKPKSKGQAVTEDLSYYCNCRDFNIYSLVFGRQIIAYYSEWTISKAITEEFVLETLKLFQLMDTYRGEGTGHTITRTNYSVIIGNESNPKGLLVSFMKQWRFYKIVNFVTNRTNDDCIEIMLEMQKLGLWSSKRDIRIIPT